MRIAVDTNELLRMAAGGDQSRLARHWRDRRFELLMSLSTLTELRTVLARTELQKFVPASTGELFVGLIEQRAVFVQPDLSAPRCRDPEDSALIATAVGGQALYLVTADPDILDDAGLHAALAPGGMKVLRAAEFLELVEANLSTTGE